MKIGKDQSGDTIIEVILAMALLALVLFTAWSVTNRASQISLAARQRVVMVNQLKEQAELIKAYNQINHDDLLKQSGALVGGNGLSTIPENPCQGFQFKDGSDAAPGGSRVISSDSTGNLKIETGTKKVDDDTTQRVWYHLKPGSGTGGYYDFYVRACWQVTGGNQKLDNAQFIVRINT